MKIHNSRYLVKVWHQSKNGDTLPETVKYLQRQPSVRQWDNSLQCLVEAYHDVAKG